MAGLCVSHGLDTNNEGKVFLAGARPVAWPYSECSLDANNGLRYDPVTDKAWVTPPTKIEVEVETAADRDIVPTAEGTTVLRHLHLEHNTLKCGNGFIMVNLTNGHAGFRMGQGNFWLLNRYITLTIDNVAVLYTGLETIAAAENTATGGTTGVRYPIAEAAPVQWFLDPGVKVEVDVHYELDVASYAASGANGFTFKPPVVAATFFTQP